MRTWWMVGFITLAGNSRNSTRRREHRHIRQVSACVCGPPAQVGHAQSNTQSGFAHARTQQTHGGKIIHLYGFSTSLERKRCVHLINTWSTRVVASVCQRVCLIYVPHFRPSASQASTSAQRSGDVCCCCVLTCVVCREFVKIYIIFVVVVVRGTRRCACVHNVRAHVSLHYSAKQNSTAAARAECRLRRHLTFSSCAWLRWQRRSFNE